MARHLNSKLHEQAKKNIITYKDTDRYTNLNITLLINNTDPILLEFIKQLTCTVREGGLRLFDAQETEASDAKKIRHFYILCVLLFNANHACSVPLHVLLTETILCQGGDQVLVQIMNRIGAVASLDTSNRLATHVVQTRLVKGIKPSLIPNALTIVSVDNIDILQPHAVVSSLDATRSWHGTSMQPMPETCLLGPQETVTISPQPDQASPIPVHRSKRRRRTVKEPGSLHGNVTQSQMNMNCDITYEYNTQKPTNNNSCSVIS